MAVAHRQADGIGLRVAGAIDAQFARQRPARRRQNGVVRGHPRPLPVHRLGQDVPAAQPAGRVETPQRDGMLRGRRAGHAQQQRLHPVGVMHQHDQRQAQHRNQRQRRVSEAAIPGRRRRQLPRQPVRRQHHAGKVGRHRPVRFAAAVLEAEGQEHQKHRRRQPPQVTHAAVGLRPGVAHHHRRRPDHEPVAQQQGGLAADVDQRPERMKALAAQAADVPNRDPAVLQVPNEDR